MRLHFHQPNAAHRRAHALAFVVVGCIERERRRLRGPRKPVFDVRLIRPVMPELREIAALLRGGCPTLQGVAVVERLLTGAATPLYGRAVKPLREER